MCIRDRPAPTHREGLRWPLQPGCPRALCHKSSVRSAAGRIQDNNFPAMKGNDMNIANILATKKQRQS